MNHRSLPTVLVIAACAALASPALAQDIAFNQLPPAVQATVTRETQGGTITDIELENKQGVVSYEVEYVASGTKYELDIAADGRLLRRELD